MISGVSACRQGRLPTRIGTCARPSSPVLAPRRRSPPSSDSRCARCRSGARLRPAGSGARPACCGPTIEISPTGVRTSVPVELISMISCVRRHLQRRDHLAVALGGLQRDDALAAAAVRREILERRELAVAIVPRRSGRSPRRRRSARSAPAPSPSLMPRTPAASRPIGRTSSSWKRIALPPLEHRMISRCAVGDRRRRPADRPSSRSTAMMPLARGRENAVSGVFLTVPWLVAMNTKCCSSYCLIGSTALIFSPSSQRQQVDHGLAARAAARLRQLVDLQPVHLAAVGEAQQRVVRVARRTASR